MFNKITVFSIKVENKPGAFAKITDVLANEGINIEGAITTSFEGKGHVLLNTNNPQATTTALKNAGIKYETQEFFEIKIQDKPGELNRVLTALKDANVNVTAEYITEKQTIVFGVDNFAAAQKALHQFEYSHSR